MNARLGSWRVVLSLVALLLTLACPAAAEVKLSGLFTDNAVLQQNKPIAIWGFCDGEDKITVTFHGQEAQAKITGGNWIAHLPAMPASNEPAELVVTGTNTTTLKNILVGEVWLASGQSNMQWPVNQSADPEKVIAAANHPLIRLYTVPRQATDEPQRDVAGRWEVCSPQTVPDFSAVAYAFGLKLSQELKVPIGLVSTNYGGTPAESWASREDLAANDTLKYMLENPPASGVQRPYGLYNAMIHPLVPLAFQGAIWYQGESNAGRAYEYRTLFPAMINSWRKAFGRDDIPFFFVQLAPFMKKEPEPGESNWAELREAQLLASLKVPNTAQAVITDLGDELDIHPKAKGPVGDRLALAALALVYGQKIEYSGPVYKNVEFRGNEAILSFDHLGGGLVAKDGELTGFTIAGEDRKFAHAQARIEGDTVVVSSPQVAKPVAVRFGWANFPVVNLWNKAGLPASPFRTDDFPLTTAPKPAG